MRCARRARRAGCSTTSCNRPSIRARPVRLPAAGAADRGAAHLAAAATAPERGYAADAFDRRIVDAAGLRSGRDRGRALGGERTRHDRHVGLSAVAVPRALDRASTPAARSSRVASRRIGGLWAAVFAVFAAAFIVNYVGAAAHRPPLPRRVVSRRAGSPTSGAPLSRRHRPAARLCDRQHVGWRQCRALRA